MLSEEALYLKNCLISTKGEKGSITVAAAIVLCSVIVLNVVLYDYAKMKAVVSCIPERMRLAGKSVLASYDALLADKYGLYGFNTSSGHSAHKDFLKYYGNTECDVSVKDSFVTPEVIKKQVCGIMKIKTPVSVIESVLEAFDVISAADESCDNHSICGKAAQKLSELQSVRDELKLKTEGYYRGDSFCINGFSQGIIGNLFLSYSDDKEGAFDQLLTRLITLHEQYEGYNKEAAALCNEIQTGVNEINNILSRADMTDGNSSSSLSASDIKKQAQTLLNNAAFKDIKHNCDVFNDRLSFLNDIKEKGIKADLSKIKGVVEKGIVKTNIMINNLNIGKAGEYTDSRGSLTDDIKRKCSVSMFYDDKFEILPADYAALPSVKEQAFTSGIYELVNVVDSGFMDDFGSFDKLFSYWDNFSFSKLLKDATESILIDDYIINHMTTRLYGVSDDKLNNEVEYILSGNASCDENNDTVEQRIIALRFILNFADIMKDAQKVSIATAMASAIAAVVSMGAGVTLYKYIIISAWALIDSYTDIEKLLKGESVPLVEIGNSEKIIELQDYDFYLRLLLLLTDSETKLLRICDIIEINMKEITGENYKLSGVYNTLAVRVITQFNFISPLLLGIGEEYKREDYCEVSY